MTLRRTDSRLIFAMSAILILVVCVRIVRSAAFVLNPALLSGAVACDLLITVPALYYFCVVRTKRAAPLTLLPVLLAGLTAVRWLTPVAAQVLLRPLMLISAPLEILSLGLLTYRIYRMRRTETPDEDKSGDGLERFCRRAKAAAGDTLLVNLGLTEMAVFYYGLGGWFLHPVALQGDAFTCHRKSGWGALLGVLIFLIGVEGMAVHFALTSWNVYAAWIWNAFDLYLILWVLADYQAMRLRPLLLTETTLVARLGLRWSGKIGLENIVSVVPFSEKEAQSGGGNYQKIALLSDPEFLITLKDPVVFSGLLGRTKRVRRVGVRVDDPALFSRLQQIAAERSL